MRVSDRIRTYDFPRQFWLEFYRGLKPRSNGTSRFTNPAQIITTVLH